MDSKDSQLFLAFIFVNYFLVATRNLDDDLTTVEILNKILFCFIFDITTRF